MRTVETSARNDATFKPCRLVVAFLITLALLVPFRTPFAASATIAPVESTVVLDPTGAPFMQRTFQLVTVVTKLQTALAAIKAGDTAAACSSLTSFINACVAQAEKKLTPEPSTQLINSAKQIKTDLGCP